MSTAIDSSLHPKSSTRVLLVDDDEVDREIVIRMLESSRAAEFTITVAKDFPETLKHLSQGAFDICLVDYYLGAHTGLDVVKNIQRSHPEVGVILLTGSEDSSIDAMALYAGASDFIGKNELSLKILERSIRYAIHHKKLSIENEYQANYDSLTKLVNRSLFFDRLDHLTKQAQRHDRKHAILYLDLDYFKNTNDVYGHDVGDAVLKSFSVRLLSVIRSVDTAARLGGDEFAVILEDIDAKNAHRVSNKIVRCMEKPFEIESLVLNLSVSVGVTLFPNEETRASGLLKQADQALYYAKKLGRKRWYQFDKKLQSIAEKSQVLETDFHIGLKSKQIYPLYQPQYRLSDGKVFGFEALARWKHPRLGDIFPDQFVPHAEKLSLLPSLTEAILLRACADIAHLNAMYPGIRMAVNISASECSNYHLIHVVKSMIDRFGINPQQLELEVTESVLMKHPEASIEVLTNLNELGVHIAIDDFGTGYSSLNYLTELPVNTLKIDMSFVQGIGVSQQKEVVVQVIIDLAKRLGFDTVAEGVETETQAVFLKSLGCDYVQGYLYSKPLPFHECHNFK